MWESPLWVVGCRREKGLVHTDKQWISQERQTHIFDLQWNEVCSGLPVMPGMMQFHSLMILCCLMRQALPMSSRIWGFTNLRPFPIKTLSIGFRAWNWFLWVMSLVISSSLSDFYVFPGPEQSWHITSITFTSVTFPDPKSWALTFSQQCPFLWKK